jgi:diguanylate cyclase (GGDEF)-like protein
METETPSSAIVDESAAPIDVVAPAPPPKPIPGSMPAVEATPIADAQSVATLTTSTKQQESTRSNTLLWLVALVLMLTGWWLTRRRHKTLLVESEALVREQRRLRTAHAQLQSQSAQLREQTILDPLTGALNRLAFANELRERTEHVARFDRLLTLIVFDLDHFKQINDRHGHLTGDLALKLVAGIVREHLVSDDLFGRFGGDEFLIACADQTLPACRDLADSIRRAVETGSAQHRPPLPGLSLSMGLAQADPGTGYMTDELFARADAALYEAKRLGRNRVVVADVSLPPVPESESAHRHL